MICAPPQSSVCAYCSTPLAPAEDIGLEPSAPRYCSYACRVLAESGGKPVAATESRTTASPWLKIGLGAALAGQTMVLGLAANLTEPTGPARLGFHVALIILTAAVLVLLGWPLLRDAAGSVRERRITIELLFVTGVIGAFAVSIYASVTGRGPVFYEVVAVLLTVYCAGQTLKARAKDRAFLEARSLRQAFASCRRLLAGGGTETVAVEHVRIGDRLSILPGEAIPADGRIEQGEAFVRETPLTGEPHPVARRIGDQVFAGSHAVDGPLIMVATCAGNNRRLDELLAAVETAAAKPSRLEAQADRIVTWFLPLVLLVAIGTFAYWAHRDSWSAGFMNAMAVLLVACPCAMGLATPAGIWNALALLAARGLVVRDADFIGRLAGITRMAFDKTGTLSDEQVALIDIATSGTSTDRARLLALVGAAQAASPHPFARAFLAGGSEAGNSPPVQINVRTVAGCGLEARGIDAHGQPFQLRVGTREWLPASAQETPLLASLRHVKGDRLVYLELDGRLAGIAALRERLRHSTPEALAQLRALGLEVSVLTGDRLERADGLGLAEVSAALTPDGKAGRIRRWQQAGERVAFVGDGVNDAPAFCAADAGVALAHGADLATATAGATLHGSDLRTLAWAVVLCRHVVRTIRTNLLFAAGYNLLGIALAASGRLHPVAAALLMVGSSATVSWRATRRIAAVLPASGEMPPLSQ